MSVDCLGNCLMAAMLKKKSPTLFYLRSRISLCPRFKQLKSGLNFMTRIRTKKGRPQGLWQTTKTTSMYCR